MKKCKNSGGDWHAGKGVDPSSKKKHNMSFINLYIVYKYLGCQAFPAGNHLRCLWWKVWPGKFRG